MKAIDWVKNKIKKPSRSTVLFWVGSSVAALAAVLPLITGAQWVLSILGVGGVALAGWQKIVGDQEQQQQLEQERNRSDAVALDYAIRSKLKSGIPLNITPDPMPTKASQVKPRRNDAME